MRNTNWVIKNTPKDIESFENIDIDLLKILYSRGINTKDKINKFLHPSLNDINDPSSLSHIDETVLFIVDCIRNNKNIWIYGDYDVDGITSTSILYLSLKELGLKNVNYYIPIRSEGYGLNKQAIDIIKDSGANVIITVDCGITSFDEVSYAKSLGIDVIITDHHELPKSKLPPALYIINPKRKDNNFQFKFLAGVGTVFMLILALFKHFNKIDSAYKYIDIVAIGTVADIVPLIEENRIFTKFGLDQLRHSHNLGLSFLISKVFENIPIEFTTYDVGFILAPIFNASGRLHDAKMAVKLLTSNNIREIEVITNELINKNIERRILQNEIIDIVENEIKTNNYNEDPIIIVSSPKFHHGVIGIVASKIVDNYNKPTVIMEEKTDEGIAIGSCRSIDGFNFVKALQSMPELFSKFGGHAGAAGFTLPIKNIKLFKKKMITYINKNMDSELFIKNIEIDKQIPVHKISYEFFKNLELLKPFGFGNPTPTFLTRNVVIENTKLIGDSKSHLMFDLKKNGYHIRNAVWFNANDEFTKLSENIFHDIVYKIKLEPYQNKFYTKVYIDDIKKSELKDDKFNIFHSLYYTKFPMQSIFYTNVEIDANKQISFTFEFDQISLYQGRKFIGKLDYNISNLIMTLTNYYNFKFQINIKHIIKNDNIQSIHIDISRYYFFESFDYTDKRLFINIKNFLIGNMEYNSFTKLALSTLFKDNKNIIINEFNKKYKDDFEVLLVTAAMYFYYKNQEYTIKSAFITSKHNESKNDSEMIITEYMNSYFHVLDENELLKNISNHKYSLVVFDYSADIDFIKNFLNSNLYETVIILRNDEINEIDIINSFETLYCERNLSKNISIINKRNKNKINKEDIVYLKYLPLNEKIKIKNMIDNQSYDKIYCDESIFEIL